VSEEEEDLQPTYCQ